MKYFCKSSADRSLEDILNNYKGSGKRWLNHLKVHGNDVTTYIIKGTPNKNELKITAESLSKYFNIVERDDFANLTEERGDGGVTPYHFNQVNHWSKNPEKRKEVSEKISRKNTGKKRGHQSEEHIRKRSESIRGDKNFNFKGYYLTPWGRFSTSSEASKIARKLRKSGEKIACSDPPVIEKYCKNNTIIKTKHFWGLNSFDLGFGFEDVRKK